MAGLTVQIPDLQGSDLWELAARQGWVAMKLYNDARGPRRHPARASGGPDGARSSKMVSRSPPACMVPFNHVLGSSGHRRVSIPSNRRTAVYWTLVMAFTVEHFRDLLRLLQEHPEWRAQLRQHVLTDEILELPALVRQLAEQVQALAAAQARAEERLARLEEGQARLEQAMAQLAEAQTRSEERLANVEERLVRVEERLVGVEEGQARLEHEVGLLRHELGVSFEEVAEDVLVALLRSRGYRLMAAPRSVQLDGEGDVDVAVEVESPEGQRLVAIVEAKLRLREGHVLAWAQRVWTPEWRARLARVGLSGPYLPYVFGLRWYFRPEEIERAMEAGQIPRIGILGPRGEAIPAPILPPPS